jgi:hypothetical protein
MLPRKQGRTQLNTVGRAVSSHRPGSVIPAPSKISFFPFVASVIFPWEPSAAVLHQSHSWLVFALAA